MGMLSRTTDMPPNIGVILWATWAKRARTRPPA